MRRLYAYAFMHDPALDYGCGHGDDAERLGMSKYDPTFYPETPLGKYATITCIYVLNTIGVREGKAVLRRIHKLLQPSGKAYIAVRRDVKGQVWSSIGTYQRNVKLDLPVWYENDSFCIYVMSK